MGELFFIIRYKHYHAQGSWSGDISFALLLKACKYSETMWTYGHLIWRVASTWKKFSQPVKTKNKL